MSKFYQEYCWKEGLPYGIRAVDPSNEEVSYKIVHDPYRKWMSIEQYCGKNFDRLIYDSRLIDFRKLQPSEQVGWERELESETDNEATYLIRNQDDRLVYREKLFFKNDRCLECQIYSPHGMLLSIHRMSYEDQGDEFNGVTLFDGNGRLVIVKKYLIDEAGQFSELIEEIWGVDNKKIEFIVK